MAYTPTASEIAEAIKNRLRDAGITQQGAADYLGMERATLSRRLNAHQPLTTPDLLGLASLLGTTLADLTSVEETAA